MCGCTWSGCSEFRVSSFEFLVCGCWSLGLAGGGLGCSSCGGGENLSLLPEGVNPRRHTKYSKLKTNNAQDPSPVAVPPSQIYIAAPHAPAARRWYAARPYDAYRSTRAAPPAAGPAASTTRNQPSVPCLRQKRWTGSDLRCKVRIHRQPAACSAPPPTEFGAVAQTSLPYRSQAC